MDRVLLNGKNMLMCHYSYRHGIFCVYVVYVCFLFCFLFVCLVLEAIFSALFVLRLFVFVLSLLEAIFFSGDAYLSNNNNYMMFQNAETQKWNIIGAKRNK
jgi:hypothetical protein